ncbi:hypothetical protein HER10_EVM0003050 [Colletotrichum scovillei]|uniref:Uncharacterized protein n=1 Tax=Colletotrichum scovillei TaxID=1209932 RepID=A0A9P7R7P8_9PEZI|nr:uncharacterized protein HER10_EVM0003050 [Colletotrichum scovillei]KAF4781765.1 hypothetical protein HER10_EVM0003050 [Colletotrichum scovillei]KAG7050439.1 hypothetical protein JMJ77_0013186 [Colletotrichum scovillei]KAG7069481.1 hypothetical protein JMJ76_0003149 [Colletotrichum scovillei]KAG7073428.1 hypothetical protein JMJ78_0014402 [Colletotrichum scovillei]
MAAHLPTINFNPLAPVTPPPEHLSFRKPALPLSAQLKRKAAEANITNDHVTMKKEQSPLNNPSMAPPKPTSIPSANADPNQPSMDPRYVAMVSRIAAYYQQRCQAISNAQQQRCQAWANMHRQKCQEMMQAAMLVVAWYIRDRIQRRRRRQKKQFRTGLRAQSTRSRVTKGEGVRRWVMNVPEGMSSPHIPGLDDIADQEEAHFSMDKEVPPDKDTKLFEMADNMIRSQYRKVEVPILGVLGFEEDESESESEADDDDFDQLMEDELEDGEVEEYDDEDLDLDDEDEEDGSELVHRGTGTGTGSRGKDSGLSS